jgi:hypothetical protein
MTSIMCIEINCAITNERLFLNMTNIDTIKSLKTKINNMLCFNEETNILKLNDKIFSVDVNDNTLEQEGIYNGCKMSMT